MEKNMNNSSKKPIHPGLYIKQQILPPNLSIKEASKLLNVSRQALSNLLNGKSNLSNQMALMLENVFNCNSSDLLDLQKKYETYQTKKSNTNPVRPYVNPYLKISTFDINNWANELDASKQLPALLRTLILSTGNKITDIEFPAFENSQQKGWDGKLYSEEATPWIPQGKSKWEFGRGNNINKKANEDFDKRTRITNIEERKDNTFVFVTPRIWTNKDQWKKEKNLYDWKEVKVLDAIDLEHWLGQSIQAQTQMYSFLNRETEGIKLLGQIWDEWAGCTNPELPTELFNSIVEQHRNVLESWLDRQPDRPFILSAETELEGMAFLKCALEQIENSFPGVYANAIVLNSISALNSLAGTSSNSIVILSSPEVEKKLGGFFKNTRTIIVRSKNMPTRNVDINLGHIHIGYEPFHIAFKNQGLENHEIDQLSRKSARSLTILRRQLTENPAIQNPAWSEDKQLAKSLIPFILIGVWDSENKSDRNILQKLTKNENYDEIEDKILDLKNKIESPVWHFGKYQGIISKIDSLYAVKNYITPNIINSFIGLANDVLRETDPTLEVPNNERWAKNFFGKNHGHSEELRISICDTLVLLSVFGNDLGIKEPDFYPKNQINNLVNNLLNTSKETPWYFYRKELPYFAEAAPNKFLEILESELNRECPDIAKLFVPTPDGIFGECLRAGLLWALEILAWNPNNLLRVVIILAKLCNWHKNDNWGETPILTLQSIFCFWMPQTNASLEERNEVLHQLIHKFPKIGWQVCMKQFESQRQIGHPNHRPRWNHVANETVSDSFRDEITNGFYHAIDLSLNWPHGYDEQTLGDLIQRFSHLKPMQKDRLWEIIRTWIKTKPIPTDYQKSKVIDEIRINILAPRGRKKNPYDKTTLKKAQKVSNILKSKSLIIQNQWLFLNSWVEGIENEQLDYKKFDELVYKKRKNALVAIWNTLGIEGIIELCSNGEASYIIGFIMAETCSDIQEKTDFIQSFLNKQSRNQRDENRDCIRGFLYNMDMDKRKIILGTLIHSFEKQEDVQILLLLSSPIEPNTLELIEELSGNIKTKYWEGINLNCIVLNETSIPKIVIELLNVGRPQVAVYFSRMNFEILDSALLLRLLGAAATQKMEIKSIYQLYSYDISEALDTLDQRSDVIINDLIPLEFQFFDILNRTDHGIKNLEKHLSNSPEFFIEALSLAFERNDGKDDTNEWGNTNPENKKFMALRCYKLIKQVKRIPGTLNNGKIETKLLTDWIVKSRNLARENDRLEVCDRMIGELLSKCPSEDDGITPCFSVCEAIEELGSEDIFFGMRIGIRNSEGPHWRKEGDDLEFKIAENYKNSADKIKYDYPKTSRMLNQIAESYIRDGQWWKEHTNKQRVLETNY